MGVGETGASVTIVFRRLAYLNAQDLNQCHWYSGQRPSFDVVKNPFITWREKTLFLRCCMQKKKKKFRSREVTSCRETS